MNISAAKLESIHRGIFASIGCSPSEAGIIARRLVDADLVGFSSHGAIQVPGYMKLIEGGSMIPNRTIKTVVENDVLAIVDGQFGFGQSIGEQAMELALRKTKKFGVAVVGLRNVGHVGRVGDWAEMAAAAGCVSLHFVNTNGWGIQVAPHGGYEKRLSTNPIAAGVPRKNAPPIILDFATSTIAGAKILVALHKGLQVPAGCVVDAEGRPTTDPRTYYGPPSGAILPFGGHKGYGLSVIVEILAGALCAADSAGPNATRMLNNMLSIVFDPSHIQSPDAFHHELERFIEYVKSSRTVAPDGEILMPGEMEARNRAAGLKRGIELDETTWKDLEKVARDRGVAV